MINIIKMICFQVFEAYEKGEAIQFTLELSSGDYEDLMIEKDDGFLELMAFEYLIEEEEAGPLEVEFAGEWYYFEYTDEALELIRYLLTY